MAVAYGNLSQVKLDIQKIISNLEILEKSVCTESNLNALRAETEEILRNLEDIPLESLKYKLKQRQRRRKYKRLQQKKSRIERNLETYMVESKSEDRLKPINVSHESITKSGQHIKAIRECQRFLKTFELFQQLHLARGHSKSNTYKLSLKLRHLKLIWNNLLHDKLQEQTPDDAKIQEQWNEVLFGPSEKLYFAEKPKLQDFVIKRQVWDSYINNKHGSSIPIGWIIPPLEANKKWRPYMKSETL